MLIAQLLGMKSKAAHILAFILIAVAGSAGLLWGAETSPSAMEAAFLGLINDARQNPLATAEGLGLDPARVLQDFPELESILRDGLPPLDYSGELYAAAGVHTQDMLSSNYYAHTSPTGVTFSDRILASGYDADLTGESIGLLGFENFVSPTAAIQVLFKKVYLDELDPSRNTQRNILDPNLREAGVSIRGGSVQRADAFLNVYLLAVNFGSRNAPELLESAIFEMLNAARANPLGALLDAGVDVETARLAFGDRAWVLEQGLAPFVWSTALQQAARGHVNDMFDRLYFGYVSPDGVSPSDRAEVAGYTGLLVDIALLPEVDPQPVVSLDAARRLVQGMLREELNREASGLALHVFNPGITHVGIGFERARFGDGSATPVTINLIGAYFGQSLDAASGFDRVLGDIGNREP